MSQAADADRIRAAVRREAQAASAALEARNERLAALADLRTAGWSWDALARLVARERHPGAPLSPAERRRLAAALRQDLARWLRVTGGHAILPPSPSPLVEQVAKSEAEVTMMKTTPVISEVQLPVRRTTTTVVEEFVEMEDDVGDADDVEDDAEDERPKRRGSR